MGVPTLTGSSTTTNGSSAIGLPLPEGNQQGLALSDPPQPSLTDILERAYDLSLSIYDEESTGQSPDAVVALVEREQGQDQMLGIDSAMVDTPPFPSVGISPFQDDNEILLFQSGNVRPVGNASNSTSTMMPLDLDHQQFVEPTPIVHRSLPRDDLRALYSTLSAQMGEEGVSSFLAMFLHHT